MTDISGELMRHPGYDWVAGPTHDWSHPAADGFVWVAYLPADDGMAWRVAGFAPTLEDAERAARATLDGTACPFCGMAHGQGPVGEPDTAFAGLEFKVCPKLPPDHIYEDVVFEKGPRGRLHRLGSDD